MIIFGQEGYFIHFWTHGYFGHLVSTGKLVIFTKKVIFGILVKIVVFTKLLYEIRYRYDIAPICRYRKISKIKIRYGWDTLIKKLYN